MINGPGLVKCLHFCVAHLFDGVQRGSYGYDRHENNGHSIVVILIGTPQDHTEELEDVKRVEDLPEQQRERLVKQMQT